MRKFLLTVSTLLLITFLVNAQSSVKYSYDSSGNRESRRIITLKSASFSQAAFSENEMAIEEEDVFKEEFKERSITIYPNPTKGNLGINISGADFNSKCRALVYNIRGQKLMDFPVQMNTITPVDMNSLAPATYILILIIDDEKLNYKIVKL